MTGAATYDISTTAAAAQLGVSPKTVQRWADEGRLPVLKTPGGVRRFRQEDLDEFVRSLISAGS